MDTIDIRRLTEDTLPLLWTVEDRRLDSERVVVRPGAAGFTLDYKPMPSALWRVGNAEREIPGGDETAAWLLDSERDIYFAHTRDRLAGQLAVEAGEYGLAVVRDVRVQMSERRRGVGRALLEMAEDWAAGRDLPGLVAEVPDGNAAACQFFTACGYKLGGIDTLRYVARDPNARKAAGLRETALFFYKFPR